MPTQNTPEKLPPFSIVQSQRNQIAAQLQDLDINYQLAVAAIEEMKAKIAELNAKIAELEKPAEKGSDETNPAA